MDRTIHIDRYYGSLKNLQDKFDRLGRQDRFQGGTAEEFTDWRENTRELLWKLLGMDRMESCPLDPVVEEVCFLEDGVRREKVRIQVEPEVWMPCYILIPQKETAGRRCFISPPGHQGAGKYSVAGRRDIPAVADSIAKYNYDYGMQLARMGHVAICPDCRGFGERRDEALQNDGEAAFLNSTCFHLAHMAEPMGQTVAGMLTWDLMRLADYVETRGEWPMEQLSCLGFSGGGMQTMWLAALDDRIRLAVISGYLYGYRDSLLTLNENCSCNYVPGLWLHLDMGDIASLIAPRPLIVQSCREDHLNGSRGMENVLEQMEVVGEAYKLLGAGSRLHHDVCGGGHRWHDENLAEALALVLE